jgi:hypothetical protein
VQNTYLLANTLAGRNVPHEVHVYPHGRHGLGLAVGDGAAAGWTAACAAWLDATLAALRAESLNPSLDSKVTP